MYCLQVAEYKLCDYKLSYGEIRKYWKDYLDNACFTTISMNERIMSSRFLSSWLRFHSWNVAPDIVLTQAANCWRFPSETLRLGVWWVPRKPVCQECFDYILRGKEIDYNTFYPWRKKVKWLILSLVVHSTQRSRKHVNTGPYPGQRGKYEDIILPNIKESAISFPLACSY